MLMTLLSIALILALNTNNYHCMSFSKLPEKCLVGLAIIGGFILLIPIAKQASSQNTCISHHARESSGPGVTIDSSRIMGSVRYCAGGS